MANKYIDLFKEIIPAVDLNLRDLWDAVDDNSRKEIKGDMFNLNRYISSVKDQPTHVQEYFVLAVNEYYNKNWNELQKDPKMLWLLLCMCNYDGPEGYSRTGDKKTFFHEWIGFKKMGTDKSNKRAKLLEEIYPNMKFDEIELLAKMSTDAEIVQLAVDHGYEQSDIKKRLK
jgi:hypothetical protein